ncbi:hypothetical protein CXF80_11800 [Shewanella sp. Actino-trap-3]|uniref:hypothetical protein n=1 Tax=Shewanella sp. Actino-trap-3 TaxID=2058331 RepID=UPI000C3253B7|nr:hypothetical protein [Shewanella sp. Actino-trap-3]PKG78934.1 hypothetical protein CXF80_11800 [Shewanella sp. Actino-trap-3]
MNNKTTSSSGHKLGQLVGDWYEKNIASAVFEAVVTELGLYLDHRFKKRACRGGKILWDDLDGNSVDYDFVIELGGDDKKFGVPLAFFETFWRRGARHSKDKARDDSGKLMPMRDTYPTARVLGIVSAGDFTRPAQEYVKSRGIDLFFIPKGHIINAWKASGIEIDYLDGANETEKSTLAVEAQKALLDHNKETEISNNLYAICGKEVFESYKKRLIAQIASIPISYGFTSVYMGDRVIFDNHEKAKDYLNSFSVNKQIEADNFNQTLIYEAVYSDGTIFERENLEVEQALKLHDEVGKVAEYFKKILNQ